MVGRYSINGQDLWTAFGVIVISGSQDLLKMPERKEPFSHDWGDGNGIEVDLSSPKFKDKNITLDVCFLAGSEADFWTKYRAFFTLLSGSGKLRLYCNDLGRSFYVYYTNSSSFEKLTPIKYAGQRKIGCRFSISFIEPEPSFWIPFTFLVDKDGNYITTTDNSLIIV